MEGRVFIELSKSARAVCPLCGHSIPKDIVRVGKETTAAGPFRTTRWHHPWCYVENFPETDFSKMDGFIALKTTDQAGLQNLKASMDSKNSDKSVKKTLSPTTGIFGSPVSKVTVALKEQMSSPAEIKRFESSKTSILYKGARLPVGWKSYSSVIIYEGDNVRPSEKIAAFDFDGTLVDTNVARPGADAWKLLYPTVPEKLAFFHHEGYKLVIFSNEANIDRWSNKRQAAIDSKLGRLKGLMELAKVPMQVFIACGKSNANDIYRKPATGMWQLLEEHFNAGRIIDKERSFYVGDAAGRKKDHSAADLEFAKTLGLKFLLPEDVFTITTPNPLESPERRLSRSRGDHADLEENGRAFSRFRLARALFQMKEA
ncbi:hypothetical protein R1sor_024228 [Riccia sorocarpa]|uniref:PARP-type domain-containing protein n=1 Tax=Riccia sorocarpa TaxID=122646 RepID=A0ABD3GPX5_9MARC